MFWLSNVHEVLSFAHLAKNWHSIHKRDESGVLKTVRDFLELFECDIYYGWMRVLKAKLLKIVNPGERFLACQPSKSGHSSFLYQALQFDIDDILGLFDRIYKALRRYYKRTSEESGTKGGRKEKELVDDDLTMGKHPAI